MNITFEVIEAFLSPIKVSWERDGKYILGNQMYFGGGVTGLGRRELMTAFDMVMHEASHFVEIDDVRALRPTGWGLRYGTYMETGSRVGFSVYVSDEHLQRELRVYTIQSRFFEYFGLQFDIESGVKLLCDVVPAFCNLPGESDEKRITLAIAKVEELRQQPEYSLAAVLKELERKKELFRVYTQDLFEVSK